MVIIIPVTCSNHPLLVCRGNLETIWEDMKMQQDLQQINGTMAGPSLHAVEQIIALFM